MQRRNQDDENNLFLLAIPEGQFPRSLAQLLVDVIFERSEYIVTSQFVFNETEYFALRVFLQLVGEIQNILQTLLGQILEKGSDDVDDARHSLFIFQLVRDLSWAEW